MKKLFFLCLLITVLVNAQEIKYIDRNGEFQPNEIVYTFGNSVKLRSEPNTISTTILKIPIAERLTILEKTEEKMLYNGIEWNWYKVNYNNQIGYILGGLLSQDTKKINDDIYLISLKKINTLYILTRLVTEKGVSENVSFFDAEYKFSISVFDNKGISDIRNMIYIDYYDSGEVFNAGGYYLFNDFGNLIKACELIKIGSKEMEDWTYEKVIFPNEEGGKPEKIIYHIDEGFFDEELGVKNSFKKRYELEWKGKEIDFKKLPK